MTLIKRIKIKPSCAQGNQGSGKQNRKQTKSVARNPSLSTYPARTHGKTPVFGRIFCVLNFFLFFLELKIVFWPCFGVSVLNSALKSEFRVLTNCFFEFIMLAFSCRKGGVMFLSYVFPGDIVCIMKNAMRIAMTL